MNVLTVKVAAVKLSVARLVEIPPVPLETAVKVGTE